MTKSGFLVTAHWNDNQCQFWNIVRWNGFLLLKLYWINKVQQKNSVISQRGLGCFKVVEHKVVEHKDVEIIFCHIHTRYNILSPMTEDGNKNEITNLISWLMSKTALKNTLNMVRNNTEIDAKRAPAGALKKCITWFRFRHYGQEMTIFSIEFS